MKNKIDEITKLWVQWNIKELPATNFAIAVGNILKTETDREWKHYILESKIKSDIVTKP